MTDPTIQKLQRDIAKLALGKPIHKPHRCIVVATYVHSIEARLATLLKEKEEAEREIKRLTDEKYNDVSEP